MNWFIRLPKRKVLGLMLIFLLALTVGLAGCAKKQEAPPAGGQAPPAQTVELKLAHFMPPAHPLHAKVLEPWAKEVEEKTNGRVKIYIYPANELVGATENVDATLAGTVDIGLVLPAYTPGRFPLTSILEFPFLFKSPLQANLTAWELMQTQPALQQEYKDFKVLWYGTTDLGHFLVNKPVKGLANLKGLRIRAPSTIYNDVLSALGAVPVTMPVSEAYDALGKGVIDGTLLPASTLYSFKLKEVVKYVVEMNMYATPLHMVMNLNSWNKLSPEDQTILTETLKPFPEKIGRLYVEEDRHGRQVAQEANISVSSLPPEEMQKFHAAVDPLIEKWLNDMEAKGLPARQVYEAAKQIAAKYENVQ